MPEHPKATENREKKVLALIETLDAQGWTPMVHHMEPMHWEAVAKTAGVNNPSPETIQIIRDRIAARYRASVELPKELPPGKL